MIDSMLFPPYLCLFCYKKRGTKLAIHVSILINPFYNLKSSEKAMQGPNFFEQNHLRVGGLTGGDRAGDMEDTLTAGDRGRNAAVVQHVSLDQLQPLAGVFQCHKMGILAITYSSAGAQIITTDTSLEIQRSLFIAVADVMRSS
jgi:hypothetical protein